MIIQALLRDVENRKITSEVIQEWLKRFELVASHTEDALDEIAYESVRRKLEIKNINLLLDEICKEATNIVLRPADQLATMIVEEPRQFRLTHPFADDSKVEGRDGDVSVEIDMLFGSKTEDDLSIVAIAGVGKSTLSQLVYKDAEDDSWAMFRKRAFEIGGPKEISNLVDIGTRMVEKCKVLPLAIKSLGA
ncbi:hypothetical protein U1Q18_039985 [Sarracenia purpurea var. burkii]